MKLIEQGVLSQDAMPPEDILLLPSLDYLDWISSLPDHLQHQIVYFSPSCSIKAQKEKVCLPLAPEDPGKCIFRGLGGCLCIF